MTIKYQILYRACDKIESVHKDKRPFGLNKLETIKVAFYSLYQSLQGFSYQFIIIGDDLSKELQDFFEQFDDVIVDNCKLGSAAKSLQKQIDIALKVPDNVWVYMSEDDYLHSENMMEEMIISYERIATQFNRDIFMCPTDYPYLYMNNEKTNILIGNKRHWRTVSKSLCTFMTTKPLLDKYWNNFYSTCLDRNDPFEKYLNEIYKKEFCISPLKSLSLHLTNVNSSYGLSPFIDYKKLWEENKY